MKKINTYIVFSVMFVLALGTNVSGGVQSVDYEIQYSGVNHNVLEIKEQMEDVYFDLIKYVNEGYIINVLYEGIDQFYFEGVEKVEITNNSLHIILDSKGKNKIKGNFYDRCESEFVKESYLKNLWDNLKK